MYRQREAMRSLVFRVSLAVLSFGFMCSAVEPASGQAPLGRLKPVSIRKMTSDEYTKRLSQHIGTRYIIRLRLEVSGDKGLYVLASGPKGTPPLGYALERRRNNIVWLDGASGTDHLKCPGVDRLTKRLGARWLWLPPAAAYEWEVEAEASRAGIDESRSVFVRQNMKRAPFELIASWYTVGDNRAGTGSN